jgi:rRNA maturation endonuclease Nob1
MARCRNCDWEITDEEWRENGGFCEQCGSEGSIPEPVEEA